MKVGIVGAGNIGLRYLQGITKQFPNAEMVVIDRDSRLTELKTMELGRTKYASSLNEISERLDLCVVATSCEQRLEIYRRCLELDPRYIVLEKYLFKSRGEFAESLSIARVPTFVNQWMFGTKAFNSLIHEGISSVVVEGSNWGLACNSVHWIDLLKRALGISNLRAGKRSSIIEVFGSKRAGYEEVYGDWIFEDTDSTKSFRLIDYPSDGLRVGLTIKVDGEEYYFDYKTVSGKGNTISHFPYFSEQIGGIIEELLKCGTCCLPTLEESVSQHLLVEDILDVHTFRPNIT
jgi:hypothetical protein